MRTRVRILAACLIALTTTGCAWLGYYVVLEHPDTGARTRCGPFFESDQEIANRCLTDYQRAGYVRVPVW